MTGRSPVSDKLLWASTTLSCGGTPSRMDMAGSLDQQKCGQKFGGFPCNNKLSCSVILPKRGVSGKNNGIDSSSAGKFSCLSLFWIGLENFILAG